MKNNIMNFRDIVMGRYATKKFDGKTIEENKVNQLMELIKLAPSSFNIQPWKIKIITDKATKEKLLPLSMNQHQVTTCSHLLVFCADTNILALVDKLEAQMLKAGAQKTAIADYIGMMRGFASGMNEEQKKNWAQRQVYLALGNALNGAKSLGFDSCPMEGFDPIGYAKALGLPNHIYPVALCPIGFAADKPNPKLRFEDIFKFY